MLFHQVHYNINEKKRKEMVHLMKYERFERLISDELATFIEHELGTHITSSKIVKEITKYIFKHKLDNGGYIILDESLRMLLNMKENEGIHHFALPRVLCQHYVPGPIYFDYRIPMELANKNCLLFKDELLAFSFMKN